MYVRVIVGSQGRHSNFGVADAMRGVDDVDVVGFPLCPLHSQHLFNSTAIVLVSTHGQKRVHDPLIPRSQL